jgi:hypothetical protein
MIQPVLGADFQVRGLLLALRAGEPFRIVRAIAMEAAHRSTAGAASAPIVAELMGTAGELAGRLDSPHALGMIEMVRGISSLMLGEWSAARVALDQADQTFRNRCTGVAWERDNAHYFGLWALFELGEIAELRCRWTVLFREAQERGDLFAASQLTTFFMTLIKLASNEIPEPRAELESMLSSREDGRFSLQHTTAFDSLIRIDLYRGDISRAWTRVNTVWPEYSRSMLLRIQMVRIRMLELRARCAVALAEKAAEPQDYLRQARNDAGRLEKEGQRWALAHAHYIRGAVAACEEDSARAVQELTWAAELYDSAEMQLNARMMRYRLGEIQPGDEPRAVREDAERWCREQGILVPVRWAGMISPGFAKISSESTETTF